MKPREAIEYLIEEVRHSQSRRPWCPDKTCTVCKRFAEDDKRTAEALHALEELVLNSPLVE